MLDKIIPTEKYIKLLKQKDNLLFHILLLMRVDEEGDYIIAKKDSHVLEEAMGLYEPVPEPNQNSQNSSMPPGIAVLEDLPNKDTRSLGEYLLDSTRKFIDGKQLSDYYSAKVLDKGSKYSALITTPNFFSTLKDKDVEDALGLTPEQLNGLHPLKAFVAKFAETFKKDTFTDDRVKYPEGLSRNPAFYFMKEEGRDPFDENFVSTLATVAYSWIVNNANNLIQHADEGINKLLGRDSKHKISATERELLSDKQILKSAFITSLGNEAIRSMGMTFKTDADGSIESKMVEALGIYIVNTLDHMGYLNMTVTIHKEVYLAIKNGKPIPEVRTEATSQNAIYFTGVATVVTPVEGKSYSNTKLTEKVKAIVDDNRLSKGLLTELFDYAQQRALPLLEAPTLKAMPNSIKRGIKRIPKRVRKALHKYASNAFTINLDNHTVLDFLEPEQQLRIFKYNATLEGVHDVNIKSVQGTNRTIKNELEAYHQLVEHLKLQPEGMTTSMYFLSSVWKSGRAGMEGLINPQASKFHRHMLGMAAWESTIDSPEKRNLFKIAVAEALGSKVDRQGDAASVEDFDRLIKQPEIADGIAAIKYLKTGVEMSAEVKLATQEAILAAIEAGGNKTHSLEALTALSTYSETEPFTTRMTKEVDGVTNGVIIGLIQLNGQNPEEMLKFLEAGGLSGDSNFVYGEWIAKVGSMDNYQRIASTLVEYMGAFRNELGSLTENGRLSSEYTKEFTTKEFGDRDTLDGIEFFIGDLGTANKLTKAARDLAKNPVMITSFGSAIKNVVESLSMDTVENFYSMLEDARGNQVALDKISEQLNKILKTDHKITTANALIFKLNKGETAKFQKLVAASIGAGMGHSIEEHFQPFIDKRKELNNAMNLVHAAFMIKYDAAYKKARDLKGANLSREEENAIVKLLEPSMASFDQAMSDGEIDTELFVASNESKTATVINDKGKVVPDPNYHVQVNSNKNLPHGPKSVTARGSVRYLGFPGVRSVILAIHSSEGAVQYKLMETSAVLNVHDTDVSGIDGAMAMAQRQNLALKEVMEDYSMRAAIQKTLLRAMKALTEDEWYALNAQLQITDYKAEGFLGHDFVKTKYVGDEKFTSPKYESVHDFVDEFTDTTRIDLAAKKELLASLKSWGQYNLNHGAYVTELYC